MITLQTIPVDCLLHVGTYFKNTDDSSIDDIDRITFAAILKDYEMLEHYVREHHTPNYYQSVVSQKVALSGNVIPLKWVIKQGCPMDEKTCYHAAGSGNL